MSLRALPLFRWSAASGIAIVLAGLAGASPAQKADLEFGRYLATECLTCHRSGTSSGAIPNIFGLEEATFATLLKAYRDKQLPNPVMQTVASRLKDDEINALAHFFAVTKKP
jgi:cytochrome c